jgi:hypothetical protein
MKSFVLFLLLALLVAPLLMGAAPKAEVAPPALVMIAPAVQVAPPIANLLALVTAFFASWQVRTLGAMILADVALGVAVALRTNTFDLKKLGNFYKSMVLPYVLGYMVLYLIVGFILPPDNQGGTIDLLNQGSVTIAWAALAGTLLGSLREKWDALYGKQPATQ